MISTNTFVFGELVEGEKEYITSIYKLVVHIDQLCLHGTTLCNDDIRLYYSMLCFYELVPHRFYSVIS